MGCTLATQLLVRAHLRSAGSEQAQQCAARQQLIGRCRGHSATQDCEEGEANAFQQICGCAKQSGVLQLPMSCAVTHYLH